MFNVIFETPFFVEFFCIGGATSDMEMGDVCVVQTGFDGNFDLILYLDEFIA